MKIGLMAIHNFSMTEMMLENLCNHVDYVSILFDTTTGSQKVFDVCEAVLKVKDVSYQINDEKYNWNRWNWRELLIRSIDKIASEGDIVLFPDHDECFHDKFYDDLEKFKKDRNRRMFFDTEMITNGWDSSKAVVKYPKARHCKAFKWEKNINYRPYKGHATPNMRRKGGDKFLAIFPVLHHCFYTEDFFLNKQLHN